MASNPSSSGNIILKKLFQQTRVTPEEREHITELFWEHVHIDTTLVGKADEGHVDKLQGKPVVGGVWTLPRHMLQRGHMAEGAVSMSVLTHNVVLFSLSCPLFALLAGTKCKRRAHWWMQSLRRHDDDIAVTVVCAAPTARLVA